MKNITLPGNDIVDLKDPDSAFPSDRFIQRVFSAREQKFLLQSNPWVLWAAKESFYKALRRTTSVPFSPVLFEVKELGSTHGTIVYADSFAEFQIHENAEWIHVWISAHPRDMVCSAELGPDNPTARDIALGRLSHWYPREQIRIEREPLAGSPPLLTLSGIRMAELLSLSHHGRFGACLISRNLTGN